MKRNVYQILKIDQTDKINNAVSMFIYHYNHDASVLDAEAMKLALVMTGQYNWEGIKSEQISFSGLARKANDYLKKQGKTNIRIKEAIVYGNGESYYTFK